MITPNAPTIFASPTTEDDGWVEGDYDRSPEEQEETFKVFIEIYNLVS